MDYEKIERAVAKPMREFLQDHGATEELLCMSTDKEVIQAYSLAEGFWKHMLTVEAEWNEAHKVEDGEFTIIARVRPIVSPAGNIQYNVVEYYPITIEEMEAHCEDIL